MTEIYKLFNGTTEADLKTGHRILVDWEQLNATIEKAIMLRPYEAIKGIVVSEAGVMVSVGQKPGRKVTTKTDE